MNLNRRNFFLGAGALAATAATGLSNLKKDTPATETATQMQRNNDAIGSKIDRVLAENPTPKPEETIERAPDMNNFIRLQNKEEFLRKDNLSKQRGPRDMKDHFSSEEIDDIVWNIYNEARHLGVMEPVAGQLAVLLCVIDRMKHRSDAPTATGVIYRAWQFSWVKKKFFPIYRENISETERKISEARIRIMGKRNLVGIRKLVTKLVSGRNIGQVRQEIVKQIEATGVEVPDTPILFYKRTDWDHTDPRNPNYNNMSASSRAHWANLVTNMRIRLERPFTIGSHTFYSAHRL